MITQSRVTRTRIHSVLGLLRRPLWSLAQCCECHLWPELVGTGRIAAES